METDKRTPLRKIRERLGVTQREIGEVLGVTPAHAANMERGLHPVMPPQALKLVEWARSRGLALTFDMVYGVELLPPAVLVASEPTPKA